MPDALAEPATCPGAHPILACAETVEGALKDAAGVSPAFMTPEDKRDALRRLVRLETQLTALRLRVLAQADELAESTTDHSPATWLAAETRADPGHTAADLVLARSLDRRWVRVGAALAEGAVSIAQARVVVQALDDLPEDEVGPELLLRAEEALIEHASRFGPRELRRIGRRIFHAAAPEVAEELEGRALEREERRAAGLTSLSLQRLGDGTTRLSGRLPDATADRLRTYLDAFTSPRRAHPADEGSPWGPRPRRRLFGEAFAALLEHVDPRRLPLHGGDATTVVVTITHEALTSLLPATAAVGEEPLSASEARRLACNARLLPAVLGGRSEVLDLGRARRLFSPAQRRALVVRDRRCRAEGCTIPAAWCESHHLQPWSSGGASDLGNGVLLCSHHHHLAHRGLHDVERRADGDLRFHRRM